MPEWLIVIIVIGALFLLVGLIFMRLLKRDAKRTSVLKAIAHTQNLAFKEFEDPEIIRKKFNTLPIFNTGTNFLLNNLMGGRVDNFEVWVGDYIYWNILEGKYKDGSVRYMDTSDKKWQTVVCVLLSKQELPAFDISLKMNMVNLSTYPKDRAIDFEEDSDFYQKYTIRAAPESEKSKVKYLITDMLQSAFKNHKGLKVEVNKGQMMLTNYQLNIKTKELIDHIQRAITIAKSLS